tara:strand:+ start:294 stop:536 length:243 start_codon:yes stop_codon:yes gene_type:complete
LIPNLKCHNCPNNKKVKAQARQVSFLKLIRAYRVTISVKGDISPNLVKWVQKTYDDNNKYIVLETGENGQKHMHMLIEFE